MAKSSGSWVVVMWLGGATFGALGCSDSGSGATPCVVGASVACACSNGQMGAQTCGSDGSFDACVCDSDGRNGSESSTNPASGDAGGSPSDDDAEPESSSPRPNASASSQPTGEGDDVAPERPASNQDGGEDELGPVSTEDVPGIGDDDEEEASTEAADLVPDLSECQLVPATLTSNTTLGRGCHLVTTPPSIAEGGRLTISAGARVYFEPNTWLEVRDGAELRLVGSESDPAVLTGAVPEPGSWGGVVLETLPEPREHLISNAVIEYAGALIPGQDDPGALIALDRWRGSIQDTTIRSSASYGVILHRPAQNDSSVSIAEESFGFPVLGDVYATFERNTLTANARPALVAPQAAGLLDEASRFGGNTSDVVEILPNEYGATNNPWSGLDVPYYTPRGFNADVLELGPGVEIIFGPGAPLVVDFALVVAGTDEEPVILRSEPGGTWAGIIPCPRQNRESPWIELTHALISDAADEPDMSLCNVDFSQ